MEIVYKTTLCLHILSGFLALLCGCVSVISKKGGKLHRNSGKVFFYSMLAVCFTSVYIAIVKDNTFLLSIGIFSFYLNYFGYMAIRDKSLRPKPLDWLVLLAAAVNSFFMVYSMNTVLMVFGAMCFFGIIQDLRTSIAVLQGKPLAKLMWLRRHIGMMMGAFIATTTAFLVVNMAFFAPLHLPAWFAWLLPTFILLPLIVYFTRKYITRRNVPE